VNKRIGDRRGRQRFEIVGNLTGTLEVWQLDPIRNLSTAGALVETTTLFAVGDRITGRLFYQGRGRDVRGEVRRVWPLRPEPADRGERRYLAGIEWTGIFEQMDELMALETAADVTAGGAHDIERRRGHRLNTLGQAEIGQPRWSTVELVDISGNGVLLLSPDWLTVGNKGRLKVRLGEKTLTAEIQVRRGDSRYVDGGGYRIGASFVALDEANRAHLEEFVGDRRP